MGDKKKYLKKKRRRCRGRKSVSTWDKEIEKNSTVWKKKKKKKKKEEEEGIRLYKAWVL